MRSEVVKKFISDLLLEALNSAKIIPRLASSFAKYPI